MSGQAPRRAYRVTFITAAILLGVAYFVLLVFAVLVIGALAYELDIGRALPTSIGVGVNLLFASLVMITASTALFLLGRSMGARLWRLGSLICGPSD